MDQQVWDQRDEIKSRVFARYASILSVAYALGKCDEHHLARNRVLSHNWGDFGALQSQLPYLKIDLLTNWSL
jgi:hypothetical protein